MATGLRQLIKRHRKLPTPELRCSECASTLDADGDELFCNHCFSASAHCADCESAEMTQERLARDLARVRRDIAQHKTVTANEGLERILSELDPAWRTFA